MKKGLLALFVIVVLLMSCGGNGSNRNQGIHKFAGVFVDEFENRFVLNDDYTGTIQFAGNDSVEKIRWNDGEDHKRPFATIEYNYNPIYYFLRDNCLYRSKDDMDTGRKAISIKYEE